MFMNDNDNWDYYFTRICETIASNSKCLSRQIGALIVRDKSIVSTGYNGPPRGARTCTSRFQLMEEICPRQEAGYKSGEGLHLCTAAHAEVNCISNAARHGVVTVGTTLYLNADILPCKGCAGQIINAGIIEVVVRELIDYDNWARQLFEEAGVIVRQMKK